MDQLASGYSSYLPNQPPAVMSGFGINPMGSVPDYGIYGSDAHRAAAMGYYDPAAYNQSPSATTAAAYSARDKHSQEGAAAQPHTSAQAPSAGQQMYANMPYYPYYYMPNQFGYQQSYGQPFMNKNMYPNMYQHSTGKPNAGAATSPYGSASPYSQSVYGQTVSGVVGGGYDDMAGLQHHLGSANLHDYQKPYSQQLPGFLGQQPSAQQTQSAQQGAGKADQLNKAGANAAGASNGHQQPQQHQHQQQGLQHGMNYFGQSFPYYPQQFQQFPHQPAQQQALPNQQQQQQQSPMGRPQPYWSQ